MTSDAFTLTLEDVLLIPGSDLQALSSNLHGRTLHRHEGVARLHIERRGPHVWAERSDLLLATQMSTYHHHFDRFSHVGMERRLARFLRRVSRLTISAADIVGLLYQYGQMVTFAQVPLILAAPSQIRFGQCAAHQWTLLPWERLHVPWAERSTAVMSVPEYVRLATRFWEAHHYSPGPDEEPNAQVRAAAARGLQSVPGLPWLVLAPDGPFELDVHGTRSRYRIRALDLPDGKLGNIWMRGTRMDVHTYNHTIIGVDARGGRHVLTADADEVFVRLIGHFQDPVYLARRVDLGERYYGKLRAHRVRLKVNRT